VRTIAANPAVETSKSARRCHTADRIADVPRSRAREKAIAALAPAYAVKAPPIPEGLHEEAVDNDTANANPSAALKVTANPSSLAQRPHNDPMRATRSSTTRRSAPHIPPANRATVTNGEADVEPTSAQRYAFTAIPTVKAQSCHSGRDCCRGSRFWSGEPHRRNARRQFAVSQRSPGTAKHEAHRPASQRSRRNLGRNHQTRPCLSTRLDEKQWSVEPGGDGRPFLDLCRPAPD